MEKFDFEKQIDVLLRVAKLLSFALMVAVFVYPLLVNAILQQGQKNETELNPLIPMLLSTAGLLILIFAKRISSIPLKNALGRRERRGMKEEVLRGWFVSVVIGQLLRSGCATIGLVISLLTYSLNWCAVLGLLAFFAIGRNWPKREELEKYLREA